MKLISIMSNEIFTKQELIELINDNFDINAQNFITNSYKRSIIDKVKKEESIFFKTSNAYSRLSVFAQFENDTWMSIDSNELS